MDLFTACMILEGQQEGDPIAALQYLIDTGVVWSLQGSYGRMAKAAIEAGHCTLP